MAEIDLERKESRSVWPWVIGLLVLALLVWGGAELLEEGDEVEMAAVEQVEVMEPATEEVEVAVGTPVPIDAMGRVDIAQIVANPVQWFGATFPDSEVEVVEVPTDRGFWIEGNSARMFALLIDNPQEEPLDINAGQTLSITDGTLRDPANMADFEGEPLDADTQRILDDQEIVLLVDETAIDIL